MPSQLHESHLLLFQNQPTLAVELIRDVPGVPMPPFREARVVSADLTDIQPAEYRADLVVQLSDDHATVHGVVVEVQLSVDEDKCFIWPSYVANLCRRLRCPVSLLVVTTDETVARWASRRVDLGALQFAPHVLSPSRIPVVVDRLQALANPELAVLSAMAHGRSVDTARALEIALAAQSASADLDSDRSRIYVDLIYTSLGEAARRALKTMDPQKYVYQSEFARQYVAQGVAQGIAQGRATLVLRQLAIRFGTVDTESERRVNRASAKVLEAIGERLLTSSTLQEALGPCGENADGRAEADAR